MSYSIINAGYISNEGLSLAKALETVMEMLGYGEADENTAIIDVDGDMVAQVEADEAGTLSLAQYC